MIEPPKPVTQLFTGRNNSPDWSPDGSQLAYASVRGRRDISGFANNADTIVVRSAETGQEREIKPELAVMHAHLGMRWSSDGRSLIIRGIDRKGNDGVFQVDAQTGKVKAILQGKMADGVYRVTSTADSKVLAFTRNDPSGGKFNSVRLRNLETGQEREIVGGPNYGFIGFSISPDGSLLAFTGREPGGASVLRVISTQGGKPRELLRLQEPEFIGAGMGGIAWTPDGRYIVFPKTGQQSKTQIGVIPVEGGEPTYLDLQLEWAMGLRIHPDGRHIVFGAGIPEREIWVMENFLPTLKAAK